MACLTRETAAEFKKALQDGTITPEKMLAATSKERLAILGKIVGEENAGWVNAALEAKILQKDQQRGMVTWAKKLTGMAPEAKRDLLSRIQKQKEVFDPKGESSFLQSLAEKRFGTEITFEEAKNVSRLASKELELKGKIKESDPIKSQSRLEYGDAAVAYEKYVDSLKVAAGKQGPSWYVRHPLQSLYRAAGVSKSMLSTMDNSFFGRQGLKMFFTNPDIWAKGFAKSWGDIGKELVKKDAMDVIKADIYSRPNALNGKYKAMKADVHIGSEEAFPSHVLGRIPLLGRLAKGAESAFNGGALRFRAELADRYIKQAESQGIDMLDPKQAEPIGKLVNAMTGRGNISMTEGMARGINATIFSIKFLKSNFDTLTAHQLQKGVTPFVRKKAATNLFKVAAGIAGTLALGKYIFGDESVEIDPRSSKFGKITVGDTSFDVSGGMASLVTLAARMVPTMHEGKLGWYSKSRDGTVRPLGTGKFGSKSALDVLWDFTQGKAAPYAALLRDLMRGEDFDGRQTYVEGHRVIPTPRTVVGAHAPIPLQNFEETMNNPNAAPLLWTTMADALGIGASTSSPKPKKSAAPKGKKLGGKGLGGKSKPGP